MLLTALELELLPLLLQLVSSPHDPDAWALVVRCIQAIHKSKQRLTRSGLSHAGRLPLLLMLPPFISDIHYPLCPRIHSYPMLHCLFIYPMINWSRSPSSLHFYLSLSLSLSMLYLLWLTCLCLHSSNALFLYVP